MTSYCGDDYTIFLKMADNVSLVQDDISIEHEDLFLRFSHHDPNIILEIISTELGKSP